MTILEEAVISGWNWLLPQPITILKTNSFGNVLLRAGDNRYYRITPEDLSCTQIAESEPALNEIISTKEFTDDWEMLRLVEESNREQGALQSGQCYHLVIPSVLGGAYAQSNIRIITIAEWIAAAGSMAEQIKDCPDGTKVRLKTTK